MGKYWINFYTDENNDKVKGNWKLTEKEAEEEKDSSLYKLKLNLRWRQTATIDKTVVEEIAKEQNLSIGEVLDCV